MKKSLYMFLLLIAVWGFQACDNAGNNQNEHVENANEANEEKEDQTNIKEDDSEFMVKAASGGLMEVQLAEMALQKSSLKSVKDFAQMMLTDHKKANEELKALAASKNITIPTAPGEDHQKHIDELSKLNGKEFEEEYMDLMVDDHKEDIELFEEAAEDAKDPDIKAFAAKTLPTLKHHLEMAEAKEVHVDHKHDQMEDNAKK